MKVYELIIDRTCETTLFFSKEKAFIELLKEVKNVETTYTINFWVDQANDLLNGNDIVIDGIGGIFFDEIYE